MKKLDRELGLFAVCTIACGAMLSGLFVLPGYAAQIGGSSAHLAFLLAGLLFVPAALSKAEMATALPEAGGDYIFIDRAFGPAVSTVTGMGTWLALMLKSAFALVGMSAYLFLVVDLPPSYLKYFACGVGLFLVFINCLGVKKTGQLQSFLVVATFIVLAVFVERGSINVRPENFSNMIPNGVIGFLSATAFVFVSYAGVTKVASAAEEIKDPSRNIPWGMLLSLILMILLYVTVVYVVVGVLQVERLGGNAGIYKNAPIAQAAAVFLGRAGEIVISIISVLALTAMANAGLLASSRYPLALSRYDQLPEIFSWVHPTFKTPVLSVIVTGSAIILSIIFLPVIQLAKLASAFMLLVFALVHLSVIVFRESEIEWYQPEFTSPFYPYVQFLGVGSSVLLIVFMGWLTIVGSLGLVGIGIVWYFAYVRMRADRLGAIFQSINTQSDDVEFFEEVREYHRGSPRSVIVPFFDLVELDPLHVERRLRLAASLCRQGEHLDVIHFLEVPEQSLLTEHDMNDNELRMLQERKRLIKDEVENEVQVDQIITHSSRRALLNYVREQTPSWIVFDWKEPSPWQSLIGIEQWWLEDLPCDALFFQENGKTDFQDLAVIVEPGPYDGEVVYAARKIASFFDSEITFLNAVDPDDDSQVEYIESYQEEMMKLAGEKTSAELISESAWDQTLVERSTELDFVLIGGHKRERLFNRDALVRPSIRNDLACNYARVRTNLESPRSILQRKKEEETDVFHLMKQKGSIIRVDPEDKVELFTRIAETFDDIADRVTDVEGALWERENMQNTYIEQGIAFPHGVLDTLDETRVRLVLLENSIQYTSENKRVSLCIVTVGPSDEREIHLQVLRQLSSVFVNLEAREKLIGASTYDEVLSLLSDHL